MKSLCVVILLVAADQLSKLIIRLACHPAQTVPLIPPVLHLTYVQNTGMAFGLFQGALGWLALCSIGVSAWLVLELRRRQAKPWPMQWGLMLVLSGAIGNLIDRVWLGYVVDFIDLRVWPVFNLADSCITIGVGLLLWHSLFTSRRSS
jgi:signal peptidase II